MWAISTEMVVPTLFLALSFADQTWFRRLSPSTGKKAGLRSSSLKTTALGSNRLHLFDHFHGSVFFHDNFARAGRNIAGRCLAAWPADPDLRRRSSRGQHLDRTVLRPISAAGMNLPCRTGLLTVPQADRRADAGGIARRTFEPYSQPRLRADVMKEFGLRSVLRHHEVHAPIPVVVTQGRPSLFAIHFHPALLTGHRRQIAFAIASEPQPPTRITARTVRRHRKKV